MAWFQHSYELPPLRFGPHVLHTPQRHPWVMRKAAHKHGNARHLRTAQQLLAGCKCAWTACTNLQLASNTSGHPAAPTGLLPDRKIARSRDHRLVDVDDKAELRGSDGNMIMRRVIPDTGPHKRQSQEVVCSKRPARKPGRRPPVQRARSFRQGIGAGSAVRRRRRRAPPLQGAPRSCQVQGAPRSGQARRGLTLTSPFSMRL